MGRGRWTVATLPLAALAASISLSGSANRRAHADAAALYLEHCAACHGKEGHGDGPTAAELKYRPRDFKAGSFAFGNTTDAMVKTILSGIPGEEQARMPPFKGVLTVAEIESVVELVRTMMPPEVLPTPAEMRMEPRDGPLFARGLIAPFKEGDPPIARGLLLGLPNGFTFEYATDDLRLLAVRRGEFVTRSDWEGRGGKPLTPLGEVVLQTLMPPKWTSFLWLGKSGEKNGVANDLPATPFLTGRLRSTSCRGGVVEMNYDLIESRGDIIGQVRERPRAAITSEGAGIVQEFEIKAPGLSKIGLALVLASDPSLPLPLSKPARARDVVEEKHPEKKHSEEQIELARATGWYVVRSTPTVTLAVCFELPEGASVDPVSWPGHDQIDAFLTTSARPLILRRTVIACGVVTIESLEKMTKELAR